MSDKRSVTVIGAGIIGIACASCLQRDGHAVTVVSRPPAGRGLLVRQLRAAEPRLRRAAGPAGRVAQHSAVAPRPAGSTRDPLELRAAPAAVARPLARRLPGSARARGIERTRSAPRAGVRELRAAPRRCRRDRSRSAHRTAVCFRAGRRGRRIRARAGTARGRRHTDRDPVGRRRARDGAGARQALPQRALFSRQRAFRQFVPPRAASSPRTFSTAAARCSAGP